MIVSDDELVRRVARARTRSYVARYTPVMEGVSPPPTLEIRREGPLTAIRWEGLDRIFDAEASSLSSLETLLDALADRTPAVDVLPIEEQTALNDALHARGYRVARCQALLAAVPREHEPLEGVEVVEVDDADEEAYAELIDAYVRGQAWKLAPGEDAEDLRRWAGWIADQYRGPSWVRYVGKLDGVAAGAGILHLGEDGVAYLANAATDPLYRKRGVQQALLRARLTRAAREGYELAGSDTSVHSTSMRNMQRAGLVLVANLCQWRPKTS